MCGSSRGSTSEPLSLPPTQSIYTTNLAQVSAMWDGAADRVDRLIANNEIEVRPIRAEWIICRHSYLCARLPPAMLSTDNIWRKGVIHLGARPYTPFGGLNFHPVSRADPALL